MGPSGTTIGGLAVLPRATGPERFAGRAAPMTGGEHEFAQAQHQLSNEGTWNATAQTDGITTAL
jgi:hypothetical protein